MKYQHEVADLESQIAWWERQAGGTSRLNAFQARLILPGLREQLALARQRAGTLAQADLVFTGAPVTGSGIDARFAALGLSEYNNLVAVVAAERDGAVATRGKLPGGATASLLISRVVHGSFGFELYEEEPAAIGMFSAPSALKGAVDEATVLLDALSRGEDEFIDVLGQHSERVLQPLRKLMSGVEKARAHVTVSTDAHRAAFPDAVAVRAASARVAVETRIAVEEREVTGELFYLPYERKFELGDQSGALDLGVEVDGSALVSNGVALPPGTRVVAQIRDVIVQRTGAPKHKYTLLSARPA